MAYSILLLAMFQLGSGAPVELHGIHGNQIADQPDRALRQSDGTAISAGCQPGNRAFTPRG
eukprot:1380402-Alexandrium_andersonii.AAC.1